ncbi:MAG: hypothetical protein Ta2G_03550 [Termitinemataceae bacterium]|nr:MAG: hypothetical protein Ta2G_03550 [Termitinemataceae bacterium]
MNGVSAELSAEKLTINRIEKSGLKVLNSGSLTVALDTVITEELIAEGAVRDLVRGVQNLRKESGLEVSDRIKLFVHGSDKLKKAYELFAQYIAAETLATAISWEQKDSQTTIEAEGENWAASLEKV